MPEGNLDLALAADRRRRGRSGLVGHGHGDDYDRDHLSPL